MKQLKLQYIATVTSQDGEAVTLRPFDTVLELETVLLEGMADTETAEVRPVYVLVDAPAPALAAPAPAGEGV